MRPQLNTYSHNTLKHDNAKEDSPQNGSKEFEDFIYLLSHDVRNSVRALVEVPQWIKEDLIANGHSISGSLAENMELMDTHTRRLDRMLTDLLVYSRVGRMQAMRSIRFPDRTFVRCAASARWVLCGPSLRGALMAAFGAWCAIHDICTTARQL